MAAPLIAVYEYQARMSRLQQGVAEAQLDLYRVR